MERVILGSGGNIVGNAGSIRVVQKQSELYRSYLGGLASMPLKAVQDFADPEIDRLVAAGFTDLLNIPQANNNDQLLSILGPNFTCKGGGNGSRWNENGLLVTELPNNRPRFTFNPETGIYQGVWLEVESITLGLTNSLNYSTVGNNTIFKNGNPFNDIFSLAHLNENTYTYLPATGSLQYGLSQHTPAIGVPYVFSAFVKMDDGLSPSSFGTSPSDDFRIVIQNATAGLYEVKHILNGIYRISSTRITIGTQSNHGIYKDANTNNRGFRTIGFQFEQKDFATSYISTINVPVTRPADTYTALEAITGTSYTIYRELNGDKIADYYHDGNRNRYINGLFDSTIAEAPSLDLTLSSNGSDKLKSVALRLGTITETELINVTI